jgi:hypothetical protein
MMASRSVELEVVREWLNGEGFRCEKIITPKVHISMAEVSILTEGLYSEWFAVVNRAESWTVRVYLVGDVLELRGIHEGDEGEAFWFLFPLCDPDCLPDLVAGIRKLGDY